MNHKKENLYKNDCIRTNSGVYLNIRSPEEDMINIIDIAHSLANNSRWGGHLDFNLNMSIAQHSILCCELLSEEELEVQKQGLLHDATEAYLLDMPKPIKKMLPDYQKVEKKLEKVIFSKFNIKYPKHPKVKEADVLMLKLEWDMLVLKKMPVTYKILNPVEAKQKFIEKYNQLWK